ncbi:hypothetical protein ACH4XW_35210, partial [Streptomyces wuyuanensis]
TQGFQGDTGAQGTQGFQGDTGAQGTQGFQGDSGVADTTTVSGNTVAVNPAAAAVTSTATCPPGTVVTGGGWQLASGNMVNMAYDRFGPISPDGWQVTFFKPLGSPAASAFAYAICATP